MRENRFRAKIKEGWEGAGDWVHFSLSDFVDTRLFGDQLDVLDLSQIVFETLGQMTPCKDRDGVIVYEGDITESDCGVRSVVIFQENGQFVHHNPAGNFDLLYDGSYKIIGNIHENPELLEDSQ